MTRSPTQTQSPAQVAGIFKSLGHPARVTIVRCLSEREHCVCELVEAVGLGWSTVSRHLSVLKAVGVIADEKRGMQVYYRLEMDCIARFIACLDDPREQSAWLRPACDCR